jgi:tRNA-specific 2-thiouridylase
MGVKSRPASVAVAMSGGVDSSMAAFLLKEQGYNVMGVTMRLWTEPAGQSAADDGPIESARRVCAMLDIPHQVIDLRAEFKAEVVDYFAQAYSHGLTPNPCVVCNRRIKFGRLLAHVIAAGADAMATGHYVRAEWRDGRYRLLKARDKRKDQSYFLYRLSQHELAHLLFPLGEYTKADVRELAQRRGVPVADRAESQETCFIPDKDYRRFLKAYMPESIRPGPIVDRRGRVLGQHKGLPFYTIGQRSGLGIAASEPLYVLALVPEENTLVVGPRSELGRSELIAVEVSYIAGQPPTGPLPITAKIRYQARYEEATLTPLSQDSARVSFRADLRDITPGQSVVFYDGEEVLGGGIISTLPQSEHPS